MERKKRKMKGAKYILLREINSSNNENEQPRYTRNHKIRYEHNVPHQFLSSLMPLNVFEQKDRFLRRKLTPEFHLNVPTSEMESALLHSSGNITFTLFREATRILDIVCKRFKSIDNFVEQSFGPRISVEEATEKITEYIKESNLPTNLDVIWCEDLVGSALMCSTGMDKNGNIPRHRKFTMLIKTNEENTYLRSQGITCLMDHELGTHYHRSFNEGLQPWYGKREIYGLGSTNTCEAVKIEEGLACVHTVLRAKHRYLGIPALLYYGSCMAEYLPFKDLFEHLGKYVFNEEQRWKHCMRIKRCLPSQDRCGGFGKDQRYFEGAITILRQQAFIDFELLMAGKLTLEEIERVKRCAITSAIRLPVFMVDKEKYITALRQIARLNGISLSQSPSVKPKARGSRPHSDSRYPPLPAQPNSSASINSPVLLHGKPSRSLVSDQSVSELETQGSRRKELINAAKVTLSNSDRSQSDSHSGSFIRSTSVRRDVSKSLRKQASNTTAEQPTSVFSDANGIMTSSCGLQVTQQIIQNKILNTLCTFNFPLSPLSNAFIPDQDYSTSMVESGKNQVGRHSFHSRANSKADKTIPNLQNNWSILPEGVCGCRLFTHGNLRVPMSEDGDDLKSANGSKNRTECKTKDNENNVDPPGIQDIPVPMILEVDLRHPLIGV